TVVARPCPPGAPLARASPAPAAATLRSVDMHGGSVPAHASPGVRRFARELGVELGRVQGTGPKARVLKEDIQNFVKQSLAGGGAPAAARGGGGGLSDLGLPAWPKVDYAKYGPIEAKPLSRIQK